MKMMTTMNTMEGIGNVTIRLHIIGKLTPRSNLMEMSVLINLRLLFNLRLKPPLNLTHLDDDVDDEDDDDDEDEGSGRNCECYHEPPYNRKAYMTVESHEDVGVIQPKVETISQACTLRTTMTTMKTKKATGNVTISLRLIGKLTRRSNPMKMSELFNPRLKPPLRLTRPEFGDGSVVPWPLLAGFAISCHLTCYLGLSKGLGSITVTGKGEELGGRGG